MLNQLRFGRGVDNRKLKATGFRYQYTSREAALNLGEHMRLRPVLAGVERAVPLRARGGGVPALEPQRAPRRAAAGADARNPASSGASAPVDE